MENRRVSFSICSGGSAPVLMGFAVHSFSFKHPHSRLAASVFMLDYICWSIGSAVARMALAHQRLIGESLLWLVITDSWEDTHTHTCCTAACACADTHLLDDPSDEISAPKLETCSLPEQHSRHQSYRREGFFGIISGPHCSLLLPTNTHLDGNRASDLHAKQPDTVLFLHFTFIGNYIPVWAYAFHHVYLHNTFVPMQLYRKCLFFSGTI